MTFRLYPPIWFLTAICAQVVLARNLPSDLGLPETVRAFGGIVAVVGGGLFLTALLSFRRHHTTVLPFDDGTKRLIDSGVFRFSRNPIYLAEAIILTGIALRSGQLWPGVIVPVFMLGIDRSVITWEEHALRARFGNQFDDYCRRTRRWL